MYDNSILTYITLTSLGSNLGATFYRYCQLDERRKTGLAIAELTHLGSNVKSRRANVLRTCKDFLGRIF